MEKRFQVFISSTFSDLKDERQAVLKAVLELGHMPAGMELFPAADDSAWQLIRDVIDGSDYYVVIIGGRYGSVDETGIGYTEKEYDYALALKKPVIPLLHQSPDNLPRDKTETDELAWKRLKSFREKVEKRHTCVYWKTVDELKAQVILGITAALKRNPSIGWIRADKVPTDATVSEVLALRNKVTELEKIAEATRISPPTGTEDLQQGDDLFLVHLDFNARDPGAYPRTGYSGSIELSWNDLFAAIAPTLINEGSDTDLRKAFKVSVAQQYRDAFGKRKELRGKELLEFKFRDDEIETCIIQFRALGLIQASIRPRSVKDTTTYWCLSPYGDYLMTQLRAIRKEPTSRSATPLETDESPAKKEKA